MHITSTKHCVVLLYRTVLARDCVFLVCIILAKLFVFIPDFLALCFHAKLALAAIIYDPYSDSYIVHTFYFLVNSSSVFFFRMAGCFD